MVLTLVYSGFLAVVVAGTLRRIVVLVALAASVVERFARISLLVKVPPFKGSVAGSALLRLITWCCKDNNRTVFPKAQPINPSTYE